MHPQKRLLIAIILLGGIAVLGSYIIGVDAFPGAGQILWGGVPQGIRPLYTANMLLAAGGYFAFTHLILFRLTPQETQIAGRFGYGLFSLLYALILFPSAMWLPLTYFAAQQSSMALLWTVRIVLFVVGAASIGLLVALLKVTPRRPTWAHRLAVVGSIAFCVQTAFLDAIVWVSAFKP